MKNIVTFLKTKTQKYKVATVGILLFLALTIPLIVYQAGQRQTYKSRATYNCISSGLTTPSNISVVETASGLVLSWSISVPGNIGYVNVSSQPKYYSSFTPMTGTQHHTASGVFLVKGNQYIISVSNYCSNSVPGDFARFENHIKFTATGVNTGTSTPTPTPKSTPTPTPKPTPTGCNRACSTQTQCSPYGLQCAYGRCRSRSCPLKTDCRCL